MRESYTSLLQGVVVIEKDINSDVMSVWSYPSIDADYEKVLLQHCPFNDEKVQGAEFLFSRFRDSWYYMATKVFDEQLSKTDTVTGVSIAVLSKEFNPEMFAVVCSLFVDLYSTNRASGAWATKLLEAYLSIFLKAKYAPKSFDANDYDNRKARSSSPITELVALVGAEAAVHMWTAALLKKRILVYCESLSELQNIVRSVPCLVWHRQPWDLLRPIVHLNSAIDKSDLKPTTSATLPYIAGTMDARAVNDPSWFDLFVDVPSQNAVIAEHARDDFEVTKLHADMAKVFTDESNLTSSQSLIKAVALKTKELLQKLQTLKEQHSDELTLESIRELGLKPNMERFLCNVALAENMVKGF